MVSHNRLNPREIVMLGLLIAVALVLSYIERLIPLNIAVPGVKLGLANVVTLLCLRVFKVSRIYLLIVVRVLLAAVFIGSLMSFWYSLTGGMLSATVMILAVKLLKDRAGLIGISVLGAIAHNVGQLMIVWIVTGSFIVSLSYFPVLLVSGVAMGIFIGLVGKVTEPYIVKINKLS